MYNIKYLYNKDKKRLLFILLKNLNGDRNKLVSFISENYYKSDNEIYKFIEENFVFEKMDGAVKLRCLDILDKQININVYLDIGCHKGIITKSVSEYFGIKKENVYGSDIDKHKDFSFNFKLLTENGMNFDNNTFDLVTCFMVFHHCKYYEILIKEIFRVLKPGGILIIKEHDCSFKNDKIVLDVLHDFYDNVLYKDMNNWHCGYKSESFWTQLMLSTGFILTSPIEIKNKKINPLRNYIAIFTKPI